MRNFLRRNRAALAWSALSVAVLASIPHVFANAPFMSGVLVTLAVMALVTNTAVVYGAERAHREIYGDFEQHADEAVEVTR